MALVALGCGELTVPTDAQIACTRDSDCPEGWSCALARQRCITPGLATVPRLQLSGQVGTDGVLLSWAPPTAPIERLQLLRAETTTDLTPHGDPIDASAGETLDVAVATDTAYRYRVQLLGGGNSWAGHPDDELAVLTLPAPVEDLVASESATGAVLHFRDPNRSTTGYRIRRSAQRGVTRTHAVDRSSSASAQEQTFADPDPLVADAVHSYQVEALNASGASEPSARNLLARPLAPGPLVVTTHGQSELELAWNDNSAHEVQWLIDRRRAASGTYTTLALVAPDTSSYLDLGLAAGESYQYRVRSSGPAGESPNAEGSGRTAWHPRLSTTAASLNASCQVSITGQATFDVDQGAAFSRASGSLDTATAVAASVDGLVGELANLALDSYPYSWAVEDTLGGQSQIAGTLALSRTDLTQPSGLLPALSASTTVTHGLQIWDAAAEQSVSMPSDRCGGCSGQPAQLAAGSHICALVGGSTRQLACWGANGKGQLGNNTFAVGRTPGRVCAVGAEDCQGSSLEDVRAFAAGASLSCAVVGDAGRLLCWGDGDNGQLGDGVDFRNGANNHAVARPVCVGPTGLAEDDPPCAGNTLEGVVDVGLAPYGVQAGHGCALMSDSSVRCWGRNNRAQLGNDRTPPAELGSPYPVEVCAEAGCAERLSGVVALRVGYQHNCVWMQDGRVLCWGFLTTSTWLPVAVEAEGGGGTLGGVLMLGSGGRYSCAVVEDARVLCWGDNSNGRLGNGTTVSSASPTPVCTDGYDQTCVPLTGAVDIALGTGFGCALLASGQVQCWGDNGVGQLGRGLGSGNPPNSVHAAPVCDVAQSGPDCQPLREVVALAAGHGRVCAIDRRGRALCWGSHYLGDGGALGSSSSTPRIVCGIDSSNDCETLLEAEFRSCFVHDVALE